MPNFVHIAIPLSLILSNLDILEKNIKAKFARENKFHPLIEMMSKGVHEYIKWILESCI